MTAMQDSAEAAFIELTQLLYQNWSIRGDFFARNPGLLEERFHSPSLFRGHSFDWRYLPLDVIEQLVKRYPEAAVQAKDREGRLPLHAVVAFDNAEFDLVQFLVEEYPAGVWEKDSAGDTPLHPACADVTSPSLEVVQLLVETAGPEIIGEGNVLGLTPLHFLHNFDNFDVVQFLAEAFPAALMLKDRWGRTPLHKALDSVSHIPFDVIQWLVNACPDAAQTTEDMYHATPLHLACWYRPSLDVIQLLVETYPNAVFQKCRRYSSFHLDQEQRLNTDDWLPLHIACTHLRVPSNVIKFLLSCMPLREFGISFIPTLLEDQGHGWLLRGHDRDRGHDIQQFHVASFQDLATEPVLHSLWQKTELLMMWAKGWDLVDPTADGRPWLVVHALAEFNVATIVVWFALQLHPDQTRTRDHLGLLPIHYALDHSTPASVENAGALGWFYLRDPHTHIGRESVAWHLFRQDPELARYASLDGQPLLYQALQTGAGHRSGDRGILDILESLIRAVPECLTGRDTVTGLRPFQLAATNEFLPLDVIYLLLRADPSKLQL